MKSDIVIHYDGTRNMETTFTPDTCLAHDADKALLDRGQSTLEFYLGDKEPPLQIDVPGAEKTILIGAKEIRIVPLIKNA